MPGVHVHVVVVFQMPLRISDISDASHPVEVGVADSFYVDTPIPPNRKLNVPNSIKDTLLSLSGSHLSFQPPKWLAPKPLFCREIPLY